MSRDYRPPLAKNKFEEALKAGGWFVFSHKKLENSEADIWSLILIFHERKNKPVFINIPPKKLLEKLINIHGVKSSYHIYPWVLKTEKGKEICIEGRGLNKEGKNLVEKGEFDSSRDLGEYYKDWSFLDGLQA